MSPPSPAPLAERMRPRTLDEFVGQRHLLGPHKFLSNTLRSGRLPSLILWGPPGSGKTTLARLLADAVEADFVAMSAVLSGVQDLRREIARAADAGPLFQRPTVLFVDEIHRFNKAQQDALLPHVERGTITLIGATTENPGFEVNNALLSRSRTLVLEPLSPTALREILDAALRDAPRGLGRLGLALHDHALKALVEASQGDARVALNTLEAAALAAHAADRRHILHADVDEALQQKVILYDKSGEAHYRAVSAFIKSLRGSDPDASLYYMNRMLEGGEDPRFIFRRMLIFASEDVGNADPGALSVVVHAMQAFEFVGMPEGVLPMTQAATYLACAPKSNAVLTAYGRSRRDARDFGDLAIPNHIVNAPTSSNRALGHGRGYRYPHNFEGNYIAEQYLPDALADRRYYEPTSNGFEATLRERLAALRDEPQQAGEPD